MNHRLIQHLVPQVQLLVKVQLQATQLLRQLLVESVLEQSQPLWPLPLQLQQYLTVDLEAEL